MQQSLLFSEAELQRLRTRLSDPEFAQAVSTLRGRAELAASREPRVQPAGVAGWTLHDVCPEHAIPLEFNWDSPHEHRCPVDGKMHRGALLDAAWWRYVNMEWEAGLPAMAVLWRLEGDRRYVEQAKRVLLNYAAKYPSYEIHGGIPFNGPGKANVQTLCEATWMIPMAWTYDLIRGDLTPEEDKLIREDFLGCAAEFLIAHHERQLHNHQCWIASAICNIGLVLGREEWVEYGLNGPFGIAQQLREGVLPGGFWLEGSVGYHIHALAALLRFVQMARHTKWDIRSNPSLRSMLTALNNMTLPDNSYPQINDTARPQRAVAMVPALEAAHGWEGDPYLGSLLMHALDGVPRATVEAFLFGADHIRPGTEMPPLKHYSSQGNGLSIIRHDAGRFFLMVKHGTGGNEHDHFDRLGLIFSALGERIAPDLGTVFYSHPMHWSWYKTTLSHNTVILGGMPHIPAEAGVYGFHEGEGHVAMDTWAAFPPSQDYYNNARFRRLILWTPDYFVDHFLVTTAMPSRVEYLFHTPGQPAGFPEGRAYTEWNPLPQYRHLSDLTIRPLRPEQTRLAWDFPKARLFARFSVPVASLLLGGQSPDCPPLSMRHSILVRQEERMKTSYTVAYQVAAPQAECTVHSLTAVEEAPGNWRIQVSVAGRVDTWQVSLADFQTPARMELVRG